MNAKAPLRFLAALVLAVGIASMGARANVRADGDLVQAFSEAFDEDGNDSSAVTVTMSATTTGNTMYVGVLHDTSGTNTGPVMTNVSFAQVTDSPFTVPSVGSCSGGTCRLTIWKGEVTTGGATSLVVTNAFANVAVVELEGDIDVFDYSHGSNASSSTLASGQATTDGVGIAIGVYFAVDAPTITGGFTEATENCDVTIAFCVGIARRTTSAASNYELTSSDSFAGWNAYVLVANAGAGPGPPSRRPCAIIGGGRYGCFP
ncbi:MAG TPA: hypothetical protein VFB99_02970 [Vicinamibacterales bacterium]|nr:hypothetical protein [Vicinamibacterales bacterium]